MQISEPVINNKNQFALFALGFRPFFLFSALSTVGLMILWLLTLKNGAPATELISPVYWHSHEMIFAYSAAVIAGFLLTAVKNWTGVQTLHRWPLVILFFIWLMPRFLYLFDVSLLWLAVIDLLFLPLLAAAVAYPIIRARQWNNLFFVGLLLLFAFAHLLFYLQFLAGLEGGEEWGVHTGLGVVLIIITVMGGRVIGFFIERGLNGEIKNYTWANHLALWGTVGFVLGQFVLPPAILSLILIAAIIGHGGRLLAWHKPQLWKVPLLWVLYLGYFWMLTGFVFSLLSAHGYIAETLAIHMFTVGAIGGITLGMMARVSLGHTGREMRSHWLVNLAFVLINMAVVVRVLFPIFWPSSTMLWVELAATGWILAFLCFSLVYLPVLIMSRVDGRPG